MKLPKTIHVTCKNKHDIANPVWRDCLNKYYEMYSPEYEIKVHDNSDIYATIEAYFPQYLDKIKKITVGAVLADVFRYLILYLEGGIYSDLDCEPLKHVGALLDSEYRYFHGDASRDNAFFVYADPANIRNKRWDFCSNPCSNSVFARVAAADRSATSGHLNAFAEPTDMKCLGHGVYADAAATILCYEFHEDWINNAHFLNDDRCCYKKVGVCQWFMMTEPKQELFLQMFMHCMKNIDRLIETATTTTTTTTTGSCENREDLHHTILSTCGPLAFTKMVMDATDTADATDKILILPSDFFCCGSFNNSVPLTKNSFIKHHFTSSWR